MAVLIDAGYLTHWPHEWTRAGMRSIRRNETAKRNFDGRAVLAEAFAHIKQHCIGAGIADQW
jgi:hypothetical protein